MKIKIHYETRQNLIFQIVTGIFGIFASLHIYSLGKPDMYVLFSYLMVFILGLNYANFGLPTLVTRSVASKISDKDFVSSVAINSFSANLILCILIITLISILQISTSSFGLQSPYFDNRFYSTAYGLTIMYFTYIHFKGILDGKGLFSQSRISKFYFNNSFLIYALITSYIDFSPLIRFSLLVFMSLPLYLYGSVYEKVNVHRFNLNKGFLFISRGRSLFLLSIILYCISYIDRIFVANFIPAMQIAGLLLVIDIASRQGILGTSLSNVMLRFFSSSSQEESQKISKVLSSYIFFYSVVSTGLIFLFGNIFIERFLEADGSITLAILLNIWLGYSIQLIHVIQFQRILSLKKESMLVNIYFIIILLALMLFFIFSKSSQDLAYIVSIIILGRPIVQILVSYTIINSKNNIYNYLLVLTLMVFAIFLNLTL